MKLIYTILPILAISYILMYWFDLPEFWQWKAYDVSRQLVMLIMSVIIYKTIRSIKYTIPAVCLIILSGFELVAEMLNQNKKGDIGDVLWQAMIVVLIIITLRSWIWKK